MMTSACAPASRVFSNAAGYSPGKWASTTVKAIPSVCAIAWTAERFA